MSDMVYSDYYDTYKNDHFLNITKSSAIQLRLGKIPTRFDTHENKKRRKWHYWLYSKYIKDGGEVAEFKCVCETMGGFYRMYFKEQKVVWVTNHYNSDKETIVKNDFDKPLPISYFKFYTGQRSFGSEKDLHSRPWMSSDICKNCQKTIGKLLEDLYQIHAINSNLGLPDNTIESICRNRIDDQKEAIRRTIRNIVDEKDILEKTIAAYKEEINNFQEEVGNLQSQIRRMTHGNENTSNSTRKIEI